MKMCL